MGKMVESQPEGRWGRNHAFIGIWASFLTQSKTLGELGFAVRLRLEIWGGGLL